MARTTTGQGRPAALFTAAFVVLLVILTLLGHYGLPDGIVAAALGGTTLIAIAAIGISAGTMQASEFYLAGRSLPAAQSGVASAAAAISGLIFLGLAASYFSDTGIAATFTVGICLGLMALAVGIAPFVRKSAAFGVVDFLGIRYGGRSVRIGAAVVAIAALLAALTAALATAALVTSILFAISGAAALTIVVAVVIASTVMGGLRAVTRSAVAEYIVMAVAFVAPVAILSLREYSLPLPPLSFGLAAKDAALLALASGRDLAPPLPAALAATSGTGPFTIFAMVLVLAAGIAALPFLVLRSATVRGADRARRSAAWALLAILVVALAAPAYPAFARLIILREVADGPLENLPDWIFAFGNLGLVRICGVDATSVDALLAACRALPDFTGNLNAGDLAISGDAIVLAGPAIFDLPFVATALVTTGALAAALATAKAAAYALAAAAGHDLYAGAINPHASAGRQLIVTRLAAALATLIAAWLAARAADEAVALAPIAISLSAGGLFPALVLAVWWKRANATGALAGIVAGGVVTAALIADHLFPGFLPFGRLGLDSLTAAIIGMPVGFVTIVAASLATDPPTEEQQATLDAIRRPGGTPFVQESESL